jgi:dihydrofolate reductase
MGPRPEVCMARLIYSALMSLDGYIADRNGKFDWAEPDAEVHAFANQLEAQVGTYLFGRRMYEVMKAWETLGTDRDPDIIRDFAEKWRAADKVVYSRSLQTVSTARTRIERVFNPELVRSLKSAADHDISISGPGLAAEAFKAELVDACHFFVSPIIIGGGTSAFPAGVRLDLTLQEERRFRNGTVYLHYRAAVSQAA